MDRRNRWLKDAIPFGIGESAQQAKQSATSGDFRESRKGIGTCWREECGKQTVETVEFPAVVYDRAEAAVLMRSCLAAREISGLNSSGGVFVKAPLFKG